MTGKVIEVLQGAVPMLALIYRRGRNSSALNARAIGPPAVQEASSD